MIALAVVAVVVVYILTQRVFHRIPATGTLTHAVPTQAATPLPTTVMTTIRSRTPVKTSVPATRTTAIPTEDRTVAATGTPEPILTARAGTYVTPTGDTSPKITEKQAIIIAQAAFNDLPAGEMTAELSTSPDFGQVWKYMLRAGTTTEASGFLDADTGTIVTFNRTIYPGGRPQNPVLTIGNARQIADSTISSRNNGILSINMTDSRYVPLVTQSGNLAGSYRFIYSRIVQDYPCDADGFIVSVDAVSGAITEFVQRWQTPDNAFMLAEDLVVPRYDATFTVQVQGKVPLPVLNLRAPHHLR